MAIHLIPRRLDLVALDEDEVDVLGGIGRAIVQDDTYELPIQILDENGDAFDLGATLSPEWTFAAQARAAFYDNDSGTAQLTFSVTVDDGPTGLVRMKAAPALTGAITALQGTWDIEMVNVSNADYDVGFTQTLFSGKWKLYQDTTRT